MLLLNFFWKAKYPINYRMWWIRVRNNKLLACLEDNELLIDHQYGFPRGRSTGDFLVYAMHCWGNIEKHDEALAVSLDFSPLA